MKLVDRFFDYIVIVFLFLIGVNESIDIFYDYLGELAYFFAGFKLSNKLLNSQIVQDFKVLLESENVEIQEVIKLFGMEVKPPRKKDDD